MMLQFNRSGRPRAASGGAARAEEQANRNDAAFEHPRKSDLAPGSALAAKRSVKGALAGLWPLAILGLGFLLTLAWSGTLLWLFVRTVLALV
jgi:hypothetical protein